MKTIKLSEASQALAEYAAGRRDEVVVLTDRNKPVAALVPLKSADRESLVLSGHPRQRSDSQTTLEPVIDPDLGQGV